MKAPRRPASARAGQRSFRFIRRRPKGLLFVEVTETGITIRAARGNFLPREQEFFVHYLAEEGFIPDWYRSFSVGQRQTMPGLQWLQEDPGSPAKAGRKKTNSFMLRLLVYSAVAWMLEMAVLFLTAR